MQRRQVLKVLFGAGIGTDVFCRALAAQAAQAGRVTAEMIQQSEWIAGIELDEDERQSTANRVNNLIERFKVLRNVEVGYDIPPALSFFADPGSADSCQPRAEVRPIETAAGRKPDSSDDLAFLPVTELGALLRTRQISSIELTKLYLERLEKYDPALLCVVTLTPELALRQAERADRELSRGQYRGPLHGIPWGAKDLIAVPGYKTTWGATPFADQKLEKQATVARRLEQAGCVLVAKLALGALAQGDRWFRGQTRNPWFQEQGSSGSSAGSASATVAGLVGFSIGSETLGSIVSPCRRCGASGLRPTFGRVSRYGCMSLSWSMDKLGPICRSVEDCALVFGAIHGRDGLDPTAGERTFHWPPVRDLRTLRVGYIDEPAFPAEGRADLKALKELGVTLVPIRLPNEIPADALTLILGTAAGAVFDDLTRQGVSEGLGSWPGTFRQAQFVPAVEYLRANRIRMLLMKQMEELMRTVDLYVGGDDAVITNLTGHPTVVLPSGFAAQGDVALPTVMTLTGRLFGETELLSVAHALQQATDHHLRRPPLERLKPLEAAVEVN